MVNNGNSVLRLWGERYKDLYKKEVKDHGSEYVQNSRFVSFFSLAVLIGIVSRIVYSLSKIEEKKLNGLSFFLEVPVDYAKSQVKKCDEFKIALKGAPPSRGHDEL